MEKQINELWARQAITDIFSRYTHGIDRCDLAMLEDIWWPEAGADFGQGLVNAVQWSKDVISFLRTMNRTHHMITNIIINFDEDMKHARSQAYVVAFHEIPSDDGPQEIVMGGRYLGTLECRAGEWRLLEHRFVIDWNSNVASTAEWSTAMYATLHLGQRKPEDPFYTRA